MFKVREYNRKSFHEKPSKETEVERTNFSTKVQVERFIQAGNQLAQWRQEQFQAMDEEDDQVTMDTNHPVKRFGYDEFQAHEDMKIAKETQKKFGGKSGSDNRSDAPRNSSNANNSVDTVNMDDSKNVKENAGNEEKTNTKDK